MNLKEILALMIKSFFIIVTGIVLSLWAVCLLFLPQLTFTYRTFGQILLMGLASSSLFILFYSRKDISKNQMRVRMGIHLVLLIAMILALLLGWGWLTIYQPVSILLTVGSILVIYLSVSAWVFYQDRQTARAFNETLLRNNKPYSGKKDRTK